MPSYAYPPAPPSVEPTPTGELDRAVQRLKAHKAAWLGVPAAERVALLDELITRFAEISPQLAARANEAKGHRDEHPASGEEWLAGPTVILKNLHATRRAVQEIRDHGAPVLPRGSISRRPSGQVTVRVFPNNTWDRLAFMGMYAEIWQEPEITPENLDEYRMGALKRPRAGGTLALVLGAGNQMSIPVTDAIYKLFSENEVVLLKMNPVNEYLGPLFREAFRPLVNMGVLDVVYGGAEVGAWLCQHADIDTIHITGSDATHDAIVWGPREGREERKARGERANDKPITSELGNVTPILVVPGPWSDRDLAYQAMNVATMVANNASFNCIAGKVLVTAKDWPLRERFLDAVRDALKKVPERKAYYPGAHDRYKRFVDTHPDKAEKLTEGGPETVPWTLIPGLDVTDADDPCFRIEPFCGVLHEAPLPAATAAEYLPQAARFANERLWGTLSCSILIHPSTRRDQASEAAFQQALDDLRYGSIAVNHFAGIVFGVPELTWGAFPGHPLEDIQSGRGVVHNTFLFDRPQKSVLYGDFVMTPRPPWFADNRNMRRVGEALTRFAAKPGVRSFVPMLWHALRS